MKELFYMCINNEAKLGVEVKRQWSRRGYRNWGLGADSAITLALSGYCLCGIFTKPQTHLRWGPLCEYCSFNWKFSSTSCSDSSCMASQWHFNPELDPRCHVCLEWSSWYLSRSEFPSILPTCVFDSLLVSASRILLKEPNCVRIDCFEGDLGVVVIVDIHGQLHNLNFLF